MELLWLDRRANRGLQQLFSFDFDDRGDEGGKDVDGKTNAHSLETGDARGVVGELGEGDEETVVEDESGEHR